MFLDTVFIRVSNNVLQDFISHKLLEIFEWLSTATLCGCWKPLSPHLVELQLVDQWISFWYLQHKNFFFFTGTVDLFKKFFQLMVPHKYHHYCQCHNDCYPHHYLTKHHCYPQHYYPHNCYWEKLHPKSYECHGFFANSNKDYSLCSKQLIYMLY